MKKKTKVYVGMDVHKDTVTIAVLPEGAREPTLVKRLSHDPLGIRLMLDRLAREHEVRACHEASGAGYVLERKIRAWGHACEIVAPSLIPRRPGERRKHDRKDAEKLARLYRAGELVTIRVPTEREERVRDLVRCRGAFQREAEDQVAFGEYLALLDYKVDRRDELDRQIEALALEPFYKEAVGRLCCLKGSRWQLVACGGVSSLADRTKGASTVATETSLDDQLNCAPSTEWPFASVASAVRPTVSPQATSVSAAGATATALTSCITVTAVVRLRPP